MRCRQVPAADLHALVAEAKAAGVKLTEIGEIRDGRSTARFLDRAGKPLVFKKASFIHF